MKGQMSIETLAIMGFSAILLIMMFSLVYPSLSQSYFQVNLSSADSAVTKLSAEITKVRLNGPGSEIHTIIDFPKGELLTEGNFLVLKVNSPYENDAVKDIGSNVLLKGNTIFENDEMRRVNIIYENFDEPLIVEIE